MHRRSSGAREARNHAHAKRRRIAYHQELVHLHSLHLRVVLQDERIRHGRVRKDRLTRGDALREGMGCLPQHHHLDLVGNRHVEHTAQRAALDVVIEILVVLAMLEDAC